MEIRLPPARIPVKITNLLGVRPFRPLNETAILESFVHRVRYLPQSTLWATRHRIEHVQGVAWRLKNVDLPYWQKVRAK